ncbi:MAG: TIR domain-containing protein [Leptolyngbya sp. SIO1D8]|nr:TIR domain-containing protein [Leptolyngbya sp. SIO1D8]
MSKELKNLTNLNLLDLSKNQLVEAPKELGKLTNLEEINLSENQLESLPKEWGKLKNLTRLYLHQNQLTTIPKELGNLSNLRQLDISKNRLTSVPKELGQLTNLMDLYLAENQLNSVPKELGKINRLRALCLTDNKLTSAPKELSQLTNLTKLYLHKNNKLGLSTAILGPTWEEVTYEEAIPASPKNILEYYFRIQSDHTPLNEAKLILVGFGAVGKTSLVNRLIHQKFNPNFAKTEGIQITKWPIHMKGDEDITLHVWDFGGQEIMHSTHQFFLTERSLYLLVLNGRQGHEDVDAEYWLELIQSFGGNSPVIVVLNKVQEHPFDVNRRALQEKFPAIRAFIHTDCKADIGINELRTAIKRETDRLEYLRAPFPASWVNIKDRLAGMAENYISFEKYRDICQQDGETDLRAQDSLAIHLHSLGIALNYKDDTRLRDTHVLNPHWVTNGIYTLLNAHELADTQGELEAACLGRTLDLNNYPPERHGFLLELMRKFELCFRFAEDDNRYLIPDLLDKQQPPEATEFNPADCLNFRYGYPILPEGILPRFIVRTHVLSDQPLRWRTGVILSFEGNRALVKANRPDRCVTISVDGPAISRRRLLAVIRSDFDRIHRSFKFTPQELVPVPGHPSVTVTYKELLAREKKGRKSFEVLLNDDELLELNVQDLLNGVDIEGSREHSEQREEWNSSLRLFYSYSHKDEVLRDQLDTHLKILERQNLIQPWHDRRIIPGDEWVNEIDDNLNHADIILLLISADFIASDYCYALELQRAMECHQAGEAQVIPIILRPADWSGTPFQKLQGLLTDAKAVTQWSDRDAAWLNVETGIKQAVKSIKARSSP